MEELQLNFSCSLLLDLTPLVDGAQRCASGYHIAETGLHASCRSRLLQDVRRSRNEHVLSSANAAVLVHFWSLLGPLFTAVVISMANPSCKFKLHVATIIISFENPFLHVLEGVVTERTMKAVEISPILALNYCIYIQ